MRGRAILVNGLLAAIAFVSLFPLAWMLSVSFMPAGAASTLPPPLLPTAPTLENYRDLFARMGMGRYFFNSFLVAFAVTLVIIRNSRRWVHYVGAAR